MFQIGKLLAYNLDVPDWNRDKNIENPEILRRFSLSFILDNPFKWATDIFFLSFEIQMSCLSCHSMKNKPPRRLQPFCLAGNPGVHSNDDAQRSISLSDCSIPLVHFKRRFICCNKNDSLAFPPKRMKGMPEPVDVGRPQNQEQNANGSLLFV
jgi:hypothetical protein